MILMTLDFLEAEVNYHDLPTPINKAAYQTLASSGGSLDGGRGAMSH